MAKYPVAGNSYVEVDDAGGTPHDLSPYLDEIEPLGPEVSFLDVTGLNNTAQRVIAGVQLGPEFTLRGLFDHTAAGQGTPSFPASWARPSSSAKARRAMAPASARLPGSSSA